MSNFISGTQKQTDLMVKGMHIAPFICYEITYADSVLQDMPRAKMLLTISNDAWFGNSLAPYQHLQMAQMRAIQTGRVVLFSTNDGVTAIINNKGQIQSQLPQFTKDVLTDEVYAYTGSTPWMHLGNKPFILLFILLLMFQKLGLRTFILKRSAKRERGVNDWLS